MRYYKKKRGSDIWVEIYAPNAYWTLKHDRNWWERKLDWSYDMLTIPNIIDCKKSQLRVEGEYGEQPLEGYHNLMPAEYHRLRDLGIK